MFEIRISAEFSAAHRLRNYRGRCENLHGHNWTVEVRVEAKTLNRDGMVMDFKRLEKKVAPVLKILDHGYLNNLPWFRKINPTSENIARFIHERLAAKRLKVKSVTVWESPGSCAVYSKDKE